MSPDWIQAWADVIQAVVVVLSIIFAIQKFFSIRKNNARLAVMKMFNLVDEFPYLVPDEARYNNMMEQKKHSVSNALGFKDELDPVPDLDYLKMGESVSAFSDEFHQNLDRLWESMDDTTFSLGRHNSEIKNLLNSATYITSLLESFKLTIEGSNERQIQKEKHFIARQLYEFMKKLCDLVDELNIMDKESAIEYFPILTEYVEVYKKIDSFFKNEINNLQHFNKLNQDKYNEFFDIDNADDIQKNYDKYRYFPISQPSKPKVQESGELEGKLDIKKKKNDELKKENTKHNEKIRQEIFSKVFDSYEFSELRRLELKNKENSEQSSLNTEELNRFNKENQQFKIFNSFMMRIGLLNNKTTYAMKRTMLTKSGDKINKRGSTYCIVNPELNTLLTNKGSELLLDNFVDSSLERLNKDFVDLSENINGENDDNTK